MRIVRKSRYIQTTGRDGFHIFITIAIITTFLFMAFPVLGQTTGYRLGVGFKGGIATIYSDIQQRKLKSHFGYSMDYWMTDIYAIGLEFGNAILEIQKDNISFRSNTLYLMADIKFKPLSLGRIHTYLLSGIELYRLSPKDENGNDFPQQRTLLYDQFKFGVPVGGGISYFLQENISLDVQGIYHFASVNYTEAFQQPSDGDDDFLTMGLSLNFYLGEKYMDTDRDGIPDVVDICPKIPEDRDGYFDEDGCPEIDNDEDGIADLMDDCPNNAEDLDGFQDEDGCPDDDNDNDRLSDWRDRCPGTDRTLAMNQDTREDFDGFEDHDGCPDFDNDGDGIVDAEDGCPNEPENFNGYEDEDGCPDRIPTVVVAPQKPVILGNVYFNTGSAQLDPNSESVLDIVAASLVGKDTTHVEIHGHTDNTGNLQMNMRLSQRRAESVRSYLISKGIPAELIIAKGFGPTQPISTNETAAGRTKNRRIEFLRANQ